MSEFDFGWSDEDLYAIAERGQALYLEGKSEEAVMLFESLVIVDPANWYFSNALATLCIRMGRAEMALGVLNDLLVRLPDDFETRLRRIEALIELGWLDDARPECLDLWRQRHDPRLLKLAMKIGISRLPGRDG